MMPETCGFALGRTVTLLPAPAQPSLLADAGAGDAAQTMAPEATAVSGVPASHPRGNRLRFANWVKAYGFTRLARELNIARTTPHEWVRESRGKCIAPSPAFMTRIIQLSEAEPFAFGPLTYDDMLSGTVGIRGQQGQGYAAPMKSQYISRRTILEEPLR